MPENADMSAWIRLGKLLEERRVRLDSRYSNLALFAEERGLNYRMAWDVEHAGRTNFRRPTRLAIDIAYGWVPGSVDRVLEGGDPTVARDPERTPDDELVPQCSVEKVVINTPGLATEFKLMFVRQHRAPPGHTDDCNPFERTGEQRAASALAS